MQPAIDPHHRLAFAGHRARLLIGEALSQSKSPRDLLVAGQVPVIRRRRHDGHVVRPPFRCRADLLEHQAVALLIELPPIVRHALVVDELVVVAEVEAKLLLRAGDSPSGGNGGGLGSYLAGDHRRGDHPHREQQGERKAGQQL
jgi:hypothetical protein